MPPASPPSSEGPRCFKTLLLDWEGRERVAAFPSRQIHRGEIDFPLPAIPTELDWVDKHIGTEPVLQIEIIEEPKAESDTQIELTASEPSGPSQKPSAILFLKRPIKKALRLSITLLEKGLARAKDILG